VERAGLKIFKEFFEEINDKKISIMYASAWFHEKGYNLIYSKHVWEDFRDIVSNFRTGDSAKKYFSLDTKRINMLLELM